MTDRPNPPCPRSEEERHAWRHVAGHRLLVERYDPRVRATIAHELREVRKARFPLLFAESYGETWTGLLIRMQRVARGEAEPPQPQEQAAEPYGAYFAQSARFATLRALVRHAIDGGAQTPLDDGEDVPAFDASGGENASLDPEEFEDRGCSIRERVHEVAREAFRSMPANQALALALDLLGVPPREAARIACGSPQAANPFALRLKRARQHMRQTLEAPVAQLADEHSVDPTSLLDRILNSFQIDPPHLAQGGTC